MAEEKLHKVILSDGRVTFNFMTCLENIVMARIVSNLWMTKNIQQDIVNFIHSDIRPGRREGSDSWQQIKNNVAATISELPLPKSIIVKLSNIVPDVGNSILKWISYHECILYSNAVDQIAHFKWTARGKIDYAETVKSILGDTDTCLLDYHKYQLACHYSLEDDIAIMAPKVMNENYLDTVQISMHPMVYYWTAQITGIDNELYKQHRDYTAINEVSIDEYILQLLRNSNNMSLRSFNKVPIKYMWDKLSKEQKAKVILPLSIGELRYTWMSNLDFEKQQQVFKEHSKTILLGMLNDWLWRDYFLPTALYILDIMEPDAYLFILSKILERLVKNSEEENEHVFDEYSYLFEQLWQSGTRNFKEYAYASEQDYGRSLKSLLFSLSWEQNLDVIGLIISNLSAQKKRDIILSFKSVKQFVCFIKNDQWDLLEQFINITISSEENILRDLKEHLIKSKGFEIGRHFLKQNALDKIEHFMNWACKSVEEIDEFRKIFRHIKSKDALNAFISSNKIDFTDLEHHIHWCTNGNPVEIKIFKVEFLNLYSNDLIYKLIYEKKNEMLDQFLKWCFSGNEENIVRFKRNISTSYSGWLIEQLYLDNNFGIYNPLSNPKRKFF